MALFNRYETNIDDVTSALNEHDDKYCNPKDYYVTEEECRKYIKDVKIGQKLNREWNVSHKNFWEWLVFGVGYFLTVTMPSVLWLWLDLDESPWGWPITFIVTGIVGGLSLYVYNHVADYFHYEYVNKHKSDFFPPVNENIERLFDDYLWKLEKEKHAKKDIIHKPCEVKKMRYP